MEEQILSISLNGSYFFETVPSTTPWKKLHIVFSFLLFNTYSFLNFPKKTSRKGHSELLLLGSFSGCSRALSPRTLLLSWMLNARQPLLSPLSICWKGWLPLRCSRTLVTRLAPPAAWACQHRSEEKGAPGPSCQLALALRAKSPFSCSHRQRPLSTGTMSAWRFTPTVPLFATTALEAYSRVTDCSASSTSRYHRLLLARPYQPVFLFLFLSAAYFLLG